MFHIASSSFRFFVWLLYIFWFGVFSRGFFWRGIFLHGTFSYFRTASLCMASLRVTSFRMASIRLLSLHLFGISHCVFSALCVASFRVALLRLFVFSRGVISSFRLSRTKRQKEMTQTSHYKANLQTGKLQNKRRVNRVNNSIPNDLPHNFLNRIEYHLHTQKAKAAPNLHIKTKQ